MIDIFRAFMFSVMIDKLGLISAIFLFDCCVVSLFSFSCFSVGYLNNFWNSILIYLWCFSTVCLCIDVI